MVEVKIVVVLGVVGSIIFVLGLLSYFGRIIGDSLNAFLPGSGQNVIDMSNNFFIWCIVLSIIVIIAVVAIIAYRSQI